MLEKPIVPLLKRERRQMGAPMGRPKIGNVPVIWPQKVVKMDIVHDAALNNQRSVSLSSMRRLRRNASSLSPVLIG
jgi:hypothetical protein